MSSFSLTETWKTIAPDSDCDRAIRRAKILSTIGPASDPTQTLVELPKAGIDVARLNMSHGTQEEHACASRP